MNIPHECFERTVRADLIVHLGSMCADEPFPDIIKDELFFDIDSAEDLKEVLGIEDLPEYIAQHFNGEEWTELVFSLAEIGLKGFFVKVATPSHAYRSETSASYSWGNYYYCWFYGHTFESALKRGFEWAEKQREKEKQRWRDAQSEGGES